MFFESITDFKNLVYYNTNQLKSLGIGIECNLDNINEFSSLFEYFQWSNLMQFNLNIQSLFKILF